MSSEYYMNFYTADSTPEMEADRGNSALKSRIKIYSIYCRLDLQSRSSIMYESNTVTQNNMSPLSQGCFCYVKYRLSCMQIEQI